MISSSNFFKKTFFTIQPEDKRAKKYNQAYGPWSEETDSLITIKNPKNSSRNRYVPMEYSTIDRESDEQRTNRSEMSKSLLLAGEHSLIKGFSRDKSLTNKKNKINPKGLAQRPQKLQTKLPAIKINESQNESLQKSILRLQGGLLNFITNNQQKSLKKFVSRSKDQNPKFQMYRKCLIAARKMMREGQHSTIFHND